MTEIVPWWDWLLCPTSELKKRKLNPADRLKHTGHTRPLSSRWAQTIGMWARLEPSDIISTIAAPDDHDRRKARTSYDVFKLRHKLTSRRTFCHDFIGTHPELKLWMQFSQVMVATYAYQRVQAVMSRMPMNAGAASKAALMTPVTEETPYLGLLPVEYMLYYYAIQRVLDETGMSFAAWVEGDLDSIERWIAKARVWYELGCDQDAALPLAATEKYPVVYEEDDRSRR